MRFDPLGKMGRGGAVGGPGEQGAEMSAPPLDFAREVGICELAAKGGCALLDRKSVV